MDGMSWLIEVVVKLLVVLGLLLTAVAYVILAERRICAFIQDRLGPNRAGVCGLLQPACDAIKALFKEDYTPPHVRPVLFTVAAGLAMSPAILVIALIPFGSVFLGKKAVVSDLNVGILYLLAVGVLSVHAILLAGYASNSKYPLLGGLRAAAQLVSYEVLFGLSIVPVVMFSGSLSLTGIVQAQAEKTAVFGGLLTLPSWFVWRNPSTTLAFLTFLVALFGELNRAPFDFPEAEQELAGGYNVEYSSMRFAMFFLGEYANIIVGSAVAVTLFLGGWTLPIAGLETAAESMWTGLLQVFVFMGKVAMIVLGIIWVRWMWPRLRFDQLMDLSWGRLIPLAMGNVIFAVILLIAGW